MEVAQARYRIKFRLVQHDFSESFPGHVGADQHRSDQIATYLCRQEPLVRHVSAPCTPDPLEVVQGKAIGHRVSFI